MTARAAHVSDGEINDIGTGVYPTAAEAMSVAADFGAALTGRHDDLCWVPFTRTTWGLMNSEGDTGITVTGT